MTYLTAITAALSLGAHIVAIYMKVQISVMTRTASSVLVTIAVILMGFRRVTALTNSLILPFENYLTYFDKGLFPFAISLLLCIGFNYRRSELRASFYNTKCPYRDRCGAVLAMIGKDK